MCSKKGFIINSLFIFSILFIILSGADFLTTSYALNNHIGYEANGAMSGIVNNTIAFLSVKALFVTVIIMLMSTCIKQSKKIAYIGMRLIIFMMVFVVANNLLVISVNALPFNTFSTGTGSIGNGNGYYDDELAFTNVDTNRNIYLTIEPNLISIVEPIGYPQGTSASVGLINKGDSVFQDAFVGSDGYIYFTDGQGLKKKKVRDSNIPILANSTSDVLTIISGASIGAIYEYDGAVYFIDGTTLKSVSSPDYQVLTVMTGVTKGQDFVIVSKSNTLTLLVSASELIQNGAVGDCSGGQKCVFITIYSSNTSVKNNLAFRAYNTNALNAGAVLDYAYSTIFVTGTYVYTNMAISATYLGSITRTIAQETTLFKSNYSVYKTNNYISPILTQNRAVSLGGYSTITMYDYSSSVYDTFNFAEMGLLSLPVVPSQLEYTTASIESLYATYYNTSNIKMTYNIVFNRFAINNLLLDSSDYRWMITMIDPNNVEKDVYQTAICTHTLLGSDCSVSETLEFAYPSNGWLAGIWQLQLYEINTVIPNRALIATSQSFTVLNTSLENQSIISTPIVDYNSGSGATALTTVDSWTALFGLGVNPISKFMFAMMWITAFSVIGFIITKFNLNGGIMMALFPFTFFIYIAYLPLWTVVIITMIVGMKLFR